MDELKTEKTIKINYGDFNFNWVKRKDEYLKSLCDIEISKFYTDMALDYYIDLISSWFDNVKIFNIKKEKINCVTLHDFFKIDKVSSEFSLDVLDFNYLKNLIDKEYDSNNLIFNYNFDKNELIVTFECNCGDNSLMKFYTFTPILDYNKNNINSFEL